MLSLTRIQKATKFNRAMTCVLGVLLSGMHPSALILAAAAATTAAANAATLPSGEQVVAGDVSFVRNGSDLMITQGSQTAIINWNDFSISSGALTQFIQNGGDAAALNRVVTLTPSMINGTLSANGQIFLINPNGITVGAGGVIDTAAFIGSTLDVSNEDFLNGGALNFIGDSDAAITNLGSISGDAGVFLFAQQIDNQGQILSADQVGLATGSRILLQPVGTDGRVSVLVATTDDSELDGDAIRNSGEVEAAMVTMEATGSAYATAVNNEGIIRAQNFDTSGGRVRLTGMGGDVRNSGTIDASGSTGGEVVVTGEEVYLTDGSTIDASGDFGGGSIKVGGGIQGQDASVENATNLFVADSATISADALISGSGGEVITFAGEQAIILGTLSAVGANGGSGGFVETSGKEYLVISKAPEIGDGGEWLIDPNNITIVKSGDGDLNIDLSDVTDPFEFPTTNDGATIDVDTLVAALTGGTSVTLLTDTNGTDGEDGNINLAPDAILDFDGIGGTSTLVLRAANDIIINGIIQDGTPGGESLNLTLIADNDANLAGGITINNTISLGGGNLTASGVNFALSNNLAANTLNTSGVTNGSNIQLSNVENVSTFTGNGLDTLTGRGGNDTFAINGSNSGTAAVTGNAPTLTFTGVANLSGGNGVDTFDIADAGSLSGTIAGGGQIGDTIDFADKTGAVAINLGDSSATAINSGAASGFSGVNILVGNNTDTSLTGSTGDDVFAINGANSGLVGGGAGVNFSGVSDLSGSGGVDTFNFTAPGSLTGTIDGGTGADVLSGVSSGDITITDPDSFSFGDIDVGANAIFINAAGAISQTAGTVTAQDLGIIAGDAVDLTTAVTNLAVQKTGTGAFTLSNTGALTIADLSALDGSLATTSIVGDASSSITAGSPITFAVDTSTSVGAGNTFTYTTNDDGAADADDITVNTGVTVDETTGSLAFDSGDSFVLAGTGAADAAQDLTIRVGVADADDDGEISLGVGTLTAGDTITLNSIQLTTPATYGGISQLAGGTITASDLALQGGGTASLIGTANDVDTLTATGTYVGDITFVDVDGLDIGTLTSDSLTLTTGNTLTQSGPIQVGALTATATAGDIDLSGSSNQITGTIITSVAGGQDTTINNNLATELGAITATGGNFNVNSLGAITQVGTLSMGTTTTNLKTLNNTGVAITLSDTANEFGTLSAQVRDAADASDTTADIQLASNNGFTFETVRTGGNVALVSAGEVTQTGTSTLVIAGELSIDTSTFAGAGDVDYLQTTGDVVFSGDTVVQGNLTVEADQAGADVVQEVGSTVSVAGVLDATSGLGGNVNLTDQDNVINSLVASDGSVFIRSVGDVDIDGTLVTGPVSGNLTVIALDEGVEFGGPAVTGTSAIDLNVGGTSSNSIGTVNFVTENQPGLAIQVAGTNDITQSVLLDVAGTSSFSSGGTTSGDIILTNASNDMTGAVSANGDSFTLVDTTNTVLGAVTTDTGNLSITSTGSITQNAATILDVAGTSTFASTGGEITLTEANLMDGAVSIDQDSANNVTLNNAQSLDLGTVDLAAAADLDITSTDSISQSGTITMAGGSLIVDATNSATLTQSNNIVNLGNVTVGGDFALTEADGYTMDGIVDASSGEITLDAAAGAVTQTAGSITATGLELTGAGSFDLSQVANDVDALAANTDGAVTYVDADDLALGTTVGATTGIATTNGSLDVTATTGNLTVEEAVNVGTGDLTLESTAGLLVQGTNGSLDMDTGTLNLNNGTGGAVGTSGAPIETTGSYTLNSAPSLAGGVFVNNSTSGDIAINTLTPANGSISITNAAGAITVNNAIESTVNGNVALNSSGAMNLNNDITGTTVTLTNDGALTRTVGTVNASTSLTLEGDGNVGDGTGANYLETSTPLIILNKPTSGDVYVSDVTTDLGLQGQVNGILAVSATDDLSVPAGQDLQNDSGSLTALIAGGSINPGATAGSVILNNGGLWLNAGTQIGASAVALMDFSNAGTITADAAGPIFLNNTAGDLSIGSLDASAFTAVDGGFALQAGITTTQVNQSIGLESASNTVVTVDDVISSNGGNISIVVDTGATSGIVVDALIESGAIGGGNYVIGGGVTINVNPRAIAGTTITLDGGGQDIVIASDQSYAGSVSFNAPGDILISAQLQATGANGNITLISDVDDNSEGGIRVFDDGGTFGLVTASGLITASGSDLIQGGLGDFNAIQLDAGSNRVVSSSALQSIILETSTSTDARNILINGNVVNTGSGTLLVQSNGSTDSNIDISGAISATSGAGTNTITLTSPGTINLSGSITTASTSTNAVTIDNTGDLIVDNSSDGFINATGNGGLFLTGTGNIASGVGNDVLETRNVGRINFDKATSNAFINQSVGDVEIQGDIGGLALTVLDGSITDSGAITATRAALDAQGDIILNNSNSIDRFVNAVGATGMSANVQANAVTTGGSFTYTAGSGSDLTLGDAVASAPFGTSGTISVVGDTFFNLSAGITNFAQLANSTINGQDIEFIISGTGSFASDVGQPFQTDNITINNTGAVTLDPSDPLFTAGTSITLQGAGSVGVGNPIQTETASLILSKGAAIDDGSGDVFLEETATGGALQIGGTSGGSVTIDLLGFGDLTQNSQLVIGASAASNGPTLANNNDATLSLSTTAGSVDLTLGAGNRVRNFGTITVEGGDFAYKGISGPTAVETRFTENVSVTNTFGVDQGITIEYGGNQANRRDLVFENNVDIVTDGDFLVFRNSNISFADGDVYLGADITTSNDSDIEFRTNSLTDTFFTPVILTDDVTLTTNSATLNVGDINFDGPVSSPTTAYDLTMNAGLGDIYFQDLVGGAAGVDRLGDLLANSGGDTTFNDQVFATNVTTDAGGNTFIVLDSGIGFAVDTTEDQTYNDAVQLVNDIDLRSDSDVTFNGTVDSSTSVEADARNLYVEASGVTSFNDNVGVTNFLETVTTDAPGSVAINDNDIAAGITIRTRGTQTYGADAGILVGGGTTGPNTLTTYTGVSDTTEGDILLNGGLDGKSAGDNDLLLIAGNGTDQAITGNIEFNGAGGATTEMGDIVIRVADDVTTTGTIASTTFLQESGLDTTTLNAAITTSSADTPAYALAPIEAGGGIQIFANSISVNDDLQANNNGRILLNSGTDLFISETTVETTGLVTADPAINNRIDLIAADDVFIGSFFVPTAVTTVQTNNGAINIDAGNADTFALDAQGVVIQGDSAFATLVSAGGDDNGTVTVTADDNDSSDILINSATVQATGIIDATTEPAIVMTASDDIVIGDPNANTDTIVQTTDGAITLTASNETSEDILGENADGIVIQGSDNTVGATALVSAGGTVNGDILVDALDTANLSVFGGDVADATAELLSADDMDVNVARTITVTGGDASDAFAQISSVGNQDILSTGGNLDVSGGDSIGAFAGIVVTGPANQTVTVVDGDATLEGGAGDGASAGIQLAADGLQTVTIGNDDDNGSGDLTITGGAGSLSFAGIQHTGVGNQIVNVDNNLTITGGTGDTANAAIHHLGTAALQEVVLGGATINGGSGNLNITGGDGNDADAYILANDADAQNVTVQGGDLTLQGNLDVVNDGSDAYIQSFASDTVQTIAVSGGSDITLIAGNGDNERAQILSGNDQFISATGVISLTGGSAAGNGSYAEIRADGIQDILAENNAAEAAAIILQGGDSTGVDDYALIIGGTDGTSTQTITTSTGSILLAGNEGNSDGFADGTTTEFGAAIVNNGLAQIIDLNGDGELSLTGGTIDNSAVAIEMTNALGIQDIDVGETSGTLTLIGGNGATGGTDAYALIRSQGTGVDAQSIQVQDSIILASNSATSSVAINLQNFGAAIIADGTQDIDTLTDGDISLTGGDVIGSSALMMTTIDGGSQTVTMNGAGDLTVTGGTGDNSTAGILLVGDSDQTVEVTLGDATLQGGDGDNSSAGIQLVGNGLQTVTIGNDTIDAPTPLGNLTINGGAGDFAFAGIENTGTGDQTVEVDNNLTILGGSGDTANASIHQSGSGNQLVRLGGVGGNGGIGDLSITGGIGNDADAYILANGATTQDVLVQSGSLSITADQDAAEDFSEAYIQSFSAGTTQTIDVASTDVTSGNIMLTAGTGTDERARILSGNVQDIDASGFLQMTGGNGAGDGSFADIRAVSTQTIDIVNSDPGVLAAIRVTGGTSTGENDYALIVGGTDGTSTQTITTTEGNIALFGQQGNSSGQINSSSSEFGAAIVNNGLAQTITLNGDGSLSVSGGTVDDSAAAIEMTNVNGIQDIDVGVASGQLILNGGTGEDAYALIRSLGTVANAQSVQVQDDITLSGNNATSNFLINGQNIGAAISSVGPQDIDVLTVGSITMTGGDVDNSAALISANDTQTVTITGLGDLDVTGGIGNNSSAGILLVGDADQTVDVLLGDATLQGGDGDNSSAGIQLVGNGLQTVTIGNDTIDAPTPLGNLTINGGAGAFAFAGIENTGTGDQTVEVDNNLTILGGSGDTANASIHQSGSGNQLVSLGGVGGNGGIGDLSITGGTGNDADAYILANGATTQDVLVQSGSLSITADQDATEDFSEAYIQSFSAGTTQTVAVASTDVTSGNITLTAGTGTDERARILSGNVQDIGASGVLSMTGGNGAGDGSFADIRAVATQTINIVNSNDSAVAIDIQGGSSTGENDYALIVGGTDDNSTQTITTTEGDIVLAGNAGNSSVQVDDSSSEFGAAIINNGLAQTITLNGDGDLSLTGGTVDDSAAAIEMTNNAANAVQTITVGVDSGDLTLDGGTGTDAYALIRSQGTGIAGADVAQVIQVQDNISLSGNNATSSFTLDGEEIGAAIVSDGSQDIDTLTDGNITLTGGDVLNSAALIASTSTTGDQFIDVGGAGNMSLLGGVGVDADAIVRGAGLNQAITVTDGNLLLDAGDATNANSDALIAATNTGAALQAIDVEGTISILGGDGGNETASIQAAGYDSALGLAQDVNALSGMLIQSGDAASGNDAFIESTGLQGRQLIVVQNNNLEILGGNGSGQEAYIAAAGLNGTFDPANGDEAAQRIDVQNGNLVVDADPNSVSGGGRTSYIESSSAGEASQYITVNGTTEVLGGDGGGDFAYIYNFGFDSSLGLAQTLISQQAVTVQSGDTGGGNAAIESFGVQGRQLIDVVTGNLSVIAGLGGGNQSSIRAAGLNETFDPLTGDEAAQRISVRAGNLIVDADPTSAAGGGRTAFIELDNTGTASQYITVNGTTDVLGGDFGGDSAYINANGFDSSLGLAQALISQQAVTVQSGDQGGGNASIESFGGQGRQLIDVVSGNLSVLSGAGGGNQAYIRTAGLNEGAGEEAQRILVRDGNLLIDAFSGTGGTSAFIESTNTGANTQILDVQGSASVLAGDDGGEDAYILSAGYDAAQGLAQDIFVRDGLLIEGGANPGTNNATIETNGAQGRQQIVVQSGGIQILGGVGTGQTSGIFNAGINDGPNDVAQRIEIQAGDLLMDAGDGVDTNSSVNIVASNTGEATQIIDVQTGGISVLAGDGAGDFALISSAGFDAAQGLAQSIFALNNILVEGGEGAGSTATVEATGSEGRQLIVTETGDLSVLGGIGNAATAQILASGLDGAGLGEETQRILVQDGNLVVAASSTINGGSAIIESFNANQSQFIDVDGASPDGTMTVNGGALNTVARIASAGAQDIEIENDIDIDALPDNSVVEIVAADTQNITSEDAGIDIVATGQDSRIDITAGLAQAIDAETSINMTAANNGDLTIQNTLGTQDVTAGTDITGDADSFGTILVQADQGAQTLTAEGLIDLDANGSGTSITVNSLDGTQDIDANGTTIDAFASDFAVISITADEQQDINANTAITLDANNASIGVLNTSGPQTIGAGTSITINALDADSGDGQSIIVSAGDGTQTLTAGSFVDMDADNSVVIVRSLLQDQTITANEGDITIDATNASDVQIRAATAQSMDANSALLVPDASIAITADLDSDVTIENVSGAQSLTADTDITVDADSEAVVLVQAVDGPQTVNAQNAILVNADNTNTSVTFNSVLQDQDIDAVDAGITLAANDDADIAMTAQTNQTINANTIIDVDASNSGNVLVEARTGTQTITAGDDIFIDATNTSDVDILAATEQSVAATDGSIAMLSDTGSFVTIGNSSGTQDVTAGTNITANVDNASNLVISADNGAQTITATEFIDLDANASSSITLVSTLGTQDVEAENDYIRLTATDSTTITVIAENTQTIDAQTFIDLIVNDSNIIVESSSADQSITAETGDITIDSINGATSIVAATTQALEATAGSIIATLNDSGLTIQNTSGPQDLTAGTDIDIDVTNGGAATIQADDGAQTLTAGGLIDLNANGNLSDITINSDSLTETQTLTANGPSATGDILVEASDDASISIVADFTQVLTSTGAIALRNFVTGALLGGDVLVQNTNGDQTLIAGTNITMDALEGTITVQADNGLQTLSAANTGGEILLNADTDSNILVTSVAADQVLTSDGVTDMTGINDGTVLVTAINSNLNSAGGVWTDDVTVGTAGTTEIVTINNSGALTVADVDPAHIHVNADTGPATIIFDGAGSVGATGSTEDLRLVTNTDTMIFDDGAKTVALDERVGDVEIEGSVDSINLILSSTGNLTDSAAIVANTATLLTSDGDIDLDSSEIAEFQGVIADGNIFITSDLLTATFSNRAVSADIPAGEGVFATGEIELFSADEIIIAADAVRSSGGNILVDAGSLILDATAGSTGGINGPTGAVGTITTDLGDQTYDAPITLLTNTQMAAPNAGALIQFNETIIGPGGLELAGDAVLNSAIGTLIDPLAYLLLNGDTIFDSAAILDPDTIVVQSDPSLTAIIGGSLINTGTMTFAQDASIMVDAQTLSSPESVFDGGDILGLTGPGAVDLTIFAGDTGSVSAISGLPAYPENFSSWDFDGSLPNPFSFTAGSAFQPNAIFYRDAPPTLVERDNERMRRLGSTKTATVAYESEESDENVSASLGRVGGLRTSSFELFDASTSTQTVFNDVVVLP